MCFGGRLYCPGCHPVTGLPFRPKKLKPIPMKTHAVPPPEQTRFAIPMTGASGSIEVHDFVAEFTVMQRYENQEDTPIEATYEFPLPENAAVSDFWAEVDGKKIRGEIKEKEEAKDDYDDAISSGHGAYLLEQDEKRPNLFTASVGNLPPGKEVLVVVRYVIELEFTDESVLRVVLPALPYPPNQAQPIFDAPTLGDKGRYAEQVAHGLKLEVNFNMSSAIKKIASPTHPIEFEFGDTTSQANVKLANEENRTAPITKDFLIDVTLREPHKPSVRLEHATANESGKKLEEAVLVSFYPDLNEEEADEIYNEMIFVIDQSGSMTRRVGKRTRMQAVKDSLHIFLRSLPEGTMFNIIGFGTKHKAMFPEGSREYNETTLAEATKYVDAMRANMGGTNILRPLVELFQKKTSDGMPRIVFVLTDGEVTNTQECIDAVRINSDTTRVFTLGIGDEASKHLVAGMAKAGEGKSFIVKAADNLDNRVMECLMAAAKPALTNLRVDWGVLSGKVRQTPYKMPPLFAGSRMCVYGFLDESLFEEGGPMAPGSDPVTISMLAETGAGPFKATAQLTTGTTDTGTASLRLVGPLAAKSLIRDLEEGRSDWHFDNQGIKLTSSPSADKIKDEIIRLSIASNIISKHTAFIAVEERDEATQGEMKLREMKFQNTSLLDAPANVGIEPASRTRGHGGLATAARTSASAPSVEGWRGGGGSLSFVNSSGGSGGGRGGGGRGGGVSGPPLSASKLGARDSARLRKKSADVSRPQQQMNQLPFDSADLQAPKAPSRSFSPSASRSSRACISAAAPPPPPASSSAMLLNSTGSAMLSEGAFSGGDSSENDDDFATLNESGEFEVQTIAKKEEAQTDDSMRALIRLQSASGAFELKALQSFQAVSESTLREALGDSADKLGSTAIVAASTAVVIALFSKRWPSSKVAWQLVVKKARTFLRKVSRQAGVEIDWDTVAAECLA